MFELEGVDAKVKKVKKVKFMIASTLPVKCKSSNRFDEEGI